MLTTDKAHKAFQNECGNAAVNHISLYVKRRKRCCQDIIHVLMI